MSALLFAALIAIVITGPACAIVVGAAARSTSLSVAGLALFGLLGMYFFYSQV